MIPPANSAATGERHRLETIDGLAAAVEAVEADDIPRSLLLLSVACVDVTELGAEPVVVEALAQWRGEGAVSSSLGVEFAALTSDAESVAGDPRVDADTRRAAFRRARALSCLRYASATTAELPEPLVRRALRESCYEASFVLNGAVGVAGVIACGM